MSIIRSSLTLVGRGKAKEELNARDWEEEERAEQMILTKVTFYSDKNNYYGEFDPGSG